MGWERLIINFDKESETELELMYSDKMRVSAIWEDPSGCGCCPGENRRSKSYSVAEVINAMKNAEVVDQQKILYAKISKLENENEDKDLKIHNLKITIKELSTCDEKERVK